MQKKGKQNNRLQKLNEYPLKIVRSLKKKFKKGESQGFINTT